MTRTAALALLTHRYRTMQRTHPAQVKITLEQFVRAHLDELLHTEGN